MRLLIDEDTAVQLIEPLRHVLLGHEVAHISDLSSKGKKDPRVLPDARVSCFLAGHTPPPSACLSAGHAINPLDADHVIVDDVHDPVRADPQPVIPASVESLRGVWIIGQGGDGCADSTHAVLVSQVTAR